MLDEIGHNRSVGQEIDPENIFLSQFPIYNKSKATLIRSFGIALFMHSHNSNKRRTAHIGVANDTHGVAGSDGSPLLRRKKQAPTSIQLQRWMLRFCAVRKTSQIMFVITALSLLMMSTVYFMAPLRPPELEPKKPYHHGTKRLDDHLRFRDNTKKPQSTKSIPITNNSTLPENEGNEIAVDKYEINSNATLKKFANRKTFPPLEPRVVRLNDHNHTFRFAFPPGAVSANDSSSSFPLPEEAVALQTRYVPLRRRNAKPLTQPESLYKAGCEPQDDWQVAYHPTCNQIHETSGGWQETYRIPDDDASEIDRLAPDVRDQTRLVNEGAFRQVWMIRDAHDGITKRAMKTLRMQGKTFDLRNHDRHRRDAMSFEMLQNSPLVVDLYASCSNTAVYDYADRGDLLGIFKGYNTEEMSPQQQEDFNLHLMKIAYNVSMSIHDAHHFNERGFATMAHTDIKTDQFIYQDGYYKLSDFNRVRFLTWNPLTKSPCGFTVAKNGGSYRAPEEYRYDLETEKVDVYSLGNVLYFLLAKEQVWKHTGNKEIYAKVMAGTRPKFPETVLNSDGIFEQYMMKAIESAWTHEPAQRPGAFQVAEIIKEGIQLKEQQAQRR